MISHTTASSASSPIDRNDLRAALARIRHRFAGMIAQQFVRTAEFPIERNTGVYFRVRKIRCADKGQARARAIGEGCGLVAALASVFLGACGGGAETVENPLTSAPDNGGDSLYTGPPARDADVLAFQQEFWSNTRTSDRCGNCHNEGFGQQPMFVRSDDVNLAYDEALTVVDREQPEMSRIVEKVGEGITGHNCWVEDPDVCATIMTTWIENWVGDAAGGGRQIVLVAPVSREPGATKNFPVDPFANSPNSFSETVYPLLEQYCSDCHSSESAVAQQPYFADPNIQTAYENAKSKINLDTPENSRFVIKLSPVPNGESHNCWTNSCANDADDMYQAILQFAGGIQETTIDPALVYSEALRLVDGTLASGGNRYEDAQIALWEFKTGNGLVAYDSSGVDPAIDLNLSPEVTWFGGWGITTNGGRAQGTTTASRKLYDVLQESGEFSIEAWVIPANVTQETARIVSYSANDQNRNFTLQQNLYDYEFRLRMGADENGQQTTDLNGNPALSTPAMDEVLQATLQHVVATYSPVEGRKIYVNGELVTQVDPTPPGTFVDWQNNFALVLGSEADGNGRWDGTIRMAAVHRRALTQQQVQQNFDVGVGEKFFLLFDISALIAAPADSSFILFEVQQFDSYAYLFDKPHFITLDGSAPEGIALEGMRVGMNGREAQVGQTYATLVETLSASEFVELGQPLSPMGAVLPLEKGPENDEFFLTFDRLSNRSYARQPYPTQVVIESPVPLEERSSDIGLKTFDEIDASFATVTGIERTDYPLTVEATYQELRQSLPAVENISTFLASHQVAIAQLAIAYCDALIDVDGDPDGTGTMFPGFDFDAANTVSFAPGNRNLFVDPLIDGVMGTNIASQPARADVQGELATHLATGDGRPDNLIDRLLNPISPETGLPPVDPVTGNPVPPSDTRGIAKGVCAALLGSAVTLLQ